MDPANFLNWYPVSWNGIQLHSLYGSAFFDCGGNWHYMVKLGPKDRGDFLYNHKKPLSVKFSKMRIWILSLGVMCNEISPKKNIMWPSAVQDDCQSTYVTKLRKTKPLVTMGVDGDKVEYGWLVNS